MDEMVCEGKRVFLRSVKPADAARVAAWKRDPLVRRMALGRSVAGTEDEQLTDIRAALESTGQLYCLVVVKEPARPVGYVRVNWMDEEHEFAWLRFAMGEERRNGHMKDALSAFLRHLFDGDAHRVEAEVYEFNEASLLLLRGLGFVEEGRKREANRSEEGYTDIVAFGLLQEDFVPVG